MNSLVEGVSYFVPDSGSGAGGFYHGDTRHLRPLSMSLDDADLGPVDEQYQPPASVTVSYADATTTVNEISDAATSKHGRTVLVRTRSVAEGRLRERFELWNHGPERRTIEVTVGLDADFADIFEVRGVCDPIDRDVRATVAAASVTYEYRYRDRQGTTRSAETTVSFDTEPATIDSDRARFALGLDPQSRAAVTVDVVPGGDDATVRTDRPAAGTDRVDPFILNEPLETGDPETDRTFARAREDVAALTTRTDHGPVPLAGAPWFVTVFGRDALLASYFLLPVAPSLARGTLRYLAARQGERDDDRADEAPGKFLHEVRSGELARTGAVPHLPYYGTVDATPLWLKLLHETWAWTGDDELVSDLWPSAAASLDYLVAQVDAVADDPFLYYRDLGNTGVRHKTWRDSANGVQYADGRQAGPPLAAADIQGYLYDAFHRAAELAGDVRDDDQLAAALRDRAERTADRFDAAFWLPDRDCYAAALTPDGERVDSVTSTVGHCLWSGIVPTGRSDALADRLLEPDVWSGWGLRTLSAADAGYSPVSYHAGGVWPHDNAIAAMGLARYGHRDAARRIVANQLRAFARFPDQRIPELFCGFDDRRPPVAYPSACLPQAWAAASPFGLLRALFGLGPDDARPTRDARSAAVIDPAAADAVAAAWGDRQ